MLVDLRELKPNPMRDFVVDPIDEEIVEFLKTSIEEDGFWGGVVCRETRDEIQIGAGHHRIRAAIAAGLTTADVFVYPGDMDDATMVRVYARENATQRGTSGTAQAGSVAAAIRFIAKVVSTGCAQKFLSTSDTAKIRGNLTGDQGIGQSVIVRFLDGVPGINNGTVMQSLSALKSSGDYARIIAEVQAEIERENREALVALAEAERERQEAEDREREAEAVRKEAVAKAKAARQEADRKRAEEDRQRAEAEAKLAEKRRAEAEEGMKQFAVLKQTRDTAAKATEASGRRAVTFDFEGVAKHLKNPYQIDVFRQSVTGAGVAPLLAVDRQEWLARQLVEKAVERKKELTGQFIKEEITTLVINAKTEARTMTKAEKERIEREDFMQRWNAHMREFSGGVRSMITAGTKMLSLLHRWPHGLTVPISGEFRRALEAGVQVINNLNKRI